MKRHRDIIIKNICIRLRQVNQQTGRKLKKLNLNEYRT